MIPIHLHLIATAIAKTNQDKCKNTILNCWNLPDSQQFQMGRR